MSRAVWWVATAVWMAGIWWLSDQPDLASGYAQDFLLRKLAHVFEFAVLTYFVYRAGADRRFSWTALLVALMVAVLYACMDEWHQTWVAGREGTVRDVVIDGVGSAAAVGLLWRRTRRRIA